jgi:TPR repeat protein
MSPGTSQRVWAAVASALLTAGALPAANAGSDSAEVAARVQIAAATFEDTLVVDCQLPGKLQQLGGMRTYLTPGALTRLPAIDCRTRGGEYTVGDLASGPLSLKRWLPLAEKDNVEAQYYVARIYANAMDGVPANYAEAAKWYQRAAQKKYAPAMQELGYLYEQGLGVPQDALAGLNLERAATGLGDDLVYASVLSANKAESDAKIAALTDQLNAASGDVQTLQAQLNDANDRLLQDGAQLAQEQARLRDLRSKLETARREPGNGDPERVRALQEQLAASEAQLQQKQDALGSLSADLQLRQAQLSTQLANSQSTNSQLNQLLAASKSESDTLRAQLAQSEQRSLQSQQELNQLRTRFLQETNELAARSAELTQLRQHGGDGLQAALDAKQAEIDRQQKLVAGLDSQLGSLKQQLASAGSGSSELGARNRDLESTLAALRMQYNQQQQELQTERAQFNALQSQSKDDRAAVVTQLTAQLNAKTVALQDEQKRIEVLQTQASQMRDAYNKERDQHALDAASASGQAQQQQQALRLAQNELTQQREALQQLQMQTAAQQLKLVQEREALASQLAGGQQASQQKIAALEAALSDRDKQIADARARLGALEQQQGSGKTANVAGNVTYRMPEAQTGSSVAPNTLLELVRQMGPANYHALVIGNSNYHYLSALKTPANDAREIAKLLEGRYGFDVKLLVDATRQQIGQAMYEYQHTLTDADRLLIYYAGHGGSKDLPPERAYWQGVDSNADDQSTWLSAIDVGEFIAQIRARHVLLVSDSCFSGVITHPTSTIVAPASDERSVKIKWQRSARMVLTSGQDEPVVDSASADPTHSLFAEQFLIVLRQNTILLSGEQLAHEVSERIAVEAARIGVKQTPSYSNLQDKQHMFGDFFFVPVVGSAQVAYVPQ